MTDFDPHRICPILIEQSPDAILCCDRDGIIRLWNRGAERLFGFTSDEALGASLDIIIPKRLRARHWLGYRQVMATGISSYGNKLLAVPALHRDGTERSIEFSIVLLRDAAHGVAGVASIMRDVSERFQREKALRAEMTALRENRATN